MSQKDLSTLQFCRVKDADLPQCAQIVRTSFATVAETFGLTRDNCPGHTSFMTVQQLQWRFDSGVQMYLCKLFEHNVGFFALCLKPDRKVELENLAVLPQYRCQGIGSAVLHFAAETAKNELGARWLTIGIMDENVPLRRWYEKHAFVCSGRQRFVHLPFTVSFWQKELH